MGHPVDLVFMKGPAVIPLAVVPIVGQGAVGRVDAVLPLSVIFVDIAAAVIKVALGVRCVPSDVVIGGRLLLTLCVDAVPQTILLC